MITRSLRRFFSQASSQPLTPQQLSTIQNITTTTLRNLCFLSHNLQIIFSTSLILNNNNLRTLRKLNNKHIDLSKSKLIQYKSSPPLIGSLSLQSLALRPTLILQSTQKYQIGRTLRKIEDNVDERLRQMNVMEIQEKEFRRYLIGVREDYHQFSEEYLQEPRSRIYDCVQTNVVGNFIDTVMGKVTKK